MKSASAALAILTVLIILCAAACGPTGAVCNTGGQTCDDYYAQLHAQWAHSQ